MSLATESIADRIEQVLLFNFKPFVLERPGNTGCSRRTVTLAAIAAIVNEGKAVDREIFADLVGVGPDYLHTAIAALRRAGMNIYSSSGRVNVVSAVLGGAV